MREGPLQRVQKIQTVPHDGYNTLNAMLFQDFDNLEKMYDKMIPFSPQFKK